MINFIQYGRDICDKGFAIIDNIYTHAEVEHITAALNNSDKSNSLFRKSKELFAIRQFLKEIPEITPLIFTDKLKAVIQNLFGDDYFVVKSIYFDKPKESNWFVAYHQDLTISVDKKIELPGYSLWTNKYHQFAVQPPVDILENNFTIRIHLDDTDENNGALKVISGSHINGIKRVDNVQDCTKNERICKVKAGGVMIMRPLLSHASGRTTNNKTRRVIHIEFSNMKLPVGINWSELIDF